MPQLHPIAVLWPQGGADQLISSRKSKTDTSLLSVETQVKGNKKPKKAARGQYEKYRELLRKGAPRLSTSLKKTFSNFG